MSSKLDGPLLLYAGVGERMSKGQEWGSRTLVATGLARRVTFFVLIQNEEVIIQALGYLAVSSSLFSSLGQ